MYSQSGGFNLIGFRKRDVYNQVEKQRKYGDMDRAFEYLKTLASTDCMMFWKFEHDVDGRLSKLFWCDGVCRSDYSVFGDVLAFDATYGRNTYKFLLIIFSGVNHHNQTCVFGSAMVSDESKETYIWVLKQFLEAMNGKAPKSVITDGDLSMRNAINTVFPSAHHRLCAWHLLRNATANVSNPRFTQLLKNCMLADIEVDEFESKLGQMVKDCGVSDAGWVVELYTKKSMWATAYIRGSFFAGFRTTSRCESLHAKLGKFIEPRYNLTEFLPHFQRCLEFMRDNELDADFWSLYGLPVLQTELKGLEMSGALVFTRDIFFLYRASLIKSITVKILECKETAVGKIFIVGKYCKPKLTWHVAHSVDAMEFKCSCRRMESFGLPCVHIIAVLVHLDVAELPKSLVVERWTKRAKQCIESRLIQQPLMGDNNLYKTRVGSFVHHCKRLAKVACIADEDYFDMWDKVANETSKLEIKHGLRIGMEEKGGICSRGVKDPPVVRTKGCGCSSVATSTKRKRKVRCGLCKREGHTRRACGYVDLAGRDDGDDQSPCCDTNDDFDDNSNCDNQGRRIRQRFDQRDDSEGQFLSSTSCGG